MTEENEVTDDSYDIEVEQIDSRDIDEARDYEHWLREDEMRDEYYNGFNE